MEKLTYAGIYNADDRGVTLAKGTKVERTAWALLVDITDRRGWRQEWDRFDDDVKDEIFATFVGVIEYVMGTDGR